VRPASRVEACGKAAERPLKAPQVAEIGWARLVDHIRLDPRQRSEGGTGQGLKDSAEPLDAVGVAVLGHEPEAAHRVVSLT
jgi:hypothetical protein